MLFKIRLQSLTFTIKIDGIAKDTIADSTVLATKLSGHHLALTPEETGSGSVLPMNIASKSITESFSSKYTNHLASNSVDISNTISSALAEEKERSKC